MGCAFAILPTASFWGWKRGTPLVILLTVFIVSSIVFKMTLFWAFVERPAELNKKFPLSSKERRNRIRRFYDSLR